MTMLYSATLASNRNRGKVIMGHDASMEVGDTLTVKVDSGSTRYKEKIEKGIIKPDVPFYTYVPGKSNVDAVTSATELYFAQRGLLYSYLGGKRYDTTFLHIREWLSASATTVRKLLVVSMRRSTKPLQHTWELVHIWRVVQCIGIKTKKK